MFVWELPWENEVLRILLFKFFRHHVVFGQVISGQEVVREIENQKTDASSKPYAEVRILSCGELIPKSKGKVELYVLHGCKLR